MLGARAAAKARAGADPTELAPGRYEVVLEPTAVSDILDALAIYGFNGRSFVDQTSFLRPGEQQFDPTITFFDDAVTPGTIGLPFDEEGTPKRIVELVTDGRSVSPTLRPADRGGSRLRKRPATASVGRGAPTRCN